jgi:hypothetical protein
MRLSAGRCARQFDGHDVFERTKQVLGGAAAMRAMHGACGRRGAVRVALRNLGGLLPFEVCSRGAWHK